MRAIRDVRIAARTHDDQLIDADHLIDLRIPLPKLGRRRRVHRQAGGIGHASGALSRRDNSK